MTRDGKLTKKEATEKFNSLYPRKIFVQSKGYVDASKRRKIWKEYLTELLKKDEISEFQYKTWSLPF